MKTYTPQADYEAEPLAIVERGEWRPEQAMEFHAIAEFFPMIEGDDFDELVRDIQKNGLLESIWLYQGKILDGRNRYMACMAAGVAPRYREYTGDNPLAFAMSMNVERRHLTPSQRACLAVDILPFYEHAAKERQRMGKEKIPYPQNGQARDAVAEIAHVNPRYVSDAKMVKEEAPHLFEEMRAGLIHMKEAVHEVKQARREQERAEKLAKTSVAPVWVGKFETGNLYRADVTQPEFIAQLPEASVDLIVTDPPWDEGSLRTYEAAAHIAVRVLKPGHFMAIYSGKMFMPEILTALTRELEYVWTFCVFQPDSNDKIQKYHLYSAWRPVLLVKKPGPSIDMVWMPDALKSLRDKNYHEWGQGTELVDKLVSGYTQPGEIVLDPFIGGASVPYVSKLLKRRYIGFDINNETIRLGMRRLSE